MILKARALVVVGLALVRAVLAVLSHFGVLTGNRRLIEGAGEVVDDCIEEGLDALVLERGTAENRSDFGSKDALTDQ